jgi:predicted acyl esterase
MIRRSLACIAAATVVLGLQTTSAFAGDVVSPSTGTHAFTTADRLVEVVDGPTNSHHTTIDTRLYQPDNATTKTPQPAVLMTHGFGGTKLSAEVVNMASFLASHGYVVLTYTSQGFGESSGCIALQSRTYDVKDARQLITQVLEPNSWVKRDSKGAVVGMVGGSYGGGIQANVAESDNRIRAINPYRTWNNLQYSLDPNNYVATGDATGFDHTLNKQGVFKRVWTSLFFASGQQEPVNGNGGCSDEPLSVPPCLGFYSPVCTTYARLNATGDAVDEDRALIADSSGSTEISKLKVPTLLVQGQHDTLFNANDAAATYTALKRNKVPVSMIWNWGGHGGYNSQPGECEAFAGGGAPSYQSFDDCYLPLRTLAFLDHWLRGKSDPHPGFTWFRDWATYSGSGPTTAYSGAASFPLRSTATYTLSGTNKLVASGATVGTSTIVNPAGGEPAAYTETPNFTGPDASPNLAQAPTDIPGQHADFTSAPFTSDVTSVGVPSLRVKLSHIAPTDLVIYAKAWDVAPDGTATLINRHIAPARIPTSALGAPVEIKLIGFAHRFVVGHSFRLTLATTDQTSFNNPVADAITITTGSGSTLTLPTGAD